jgi:hypothetical protein
LIDFPYEVEDIKKPLAFAKANFTNGDKVYVYYPVLGGFQFYKDNYLPETTEIVYGTASREDYQKYDAQIDQLSGRVWFIFSHIYTNRAGIPEDKYIINVATKRGKVIFQDSYHYASVYLVEFVPPQ